MRHLKLLIKIGIILSIILIISIFTTEKIIQKSTENKTYNSNQEIHHNKVGLLLGTTKYLSDGKINLYYKYRIDAATELFQLEKIDFLLVSGDNSTEKYDEPTTIKNDLIINGIPENKIYLDYAGFRTLDSIIRSKEIFGQEKITIISQQFHNERAIFIANKKGIEAIGFNAKDVEFSRGPRVYLRERLARVKMMIDIVFNKQPKFLGRQIEIN